MLPPPPSGPITPTQIAFYDTECYINYWMLGFRIKGGPTYRFELREERPFTLEEVERIKLLFQCFTTVSFNGNHYDVPMLTAALYGCTPSQLKHISDKIIVEQVKPWELGLPEWKPTDHIDIKEVCPGQHSLKKYAAVVGSKMIQDLPYPPSSVLTSEMVDNIVTYNGYDLDDLEDIWNAIQPEIKLREDMSRRYEIDLRSKSDAQLAEAVLKKRCELALGTRIYRSDPDWNLSFRYDPPSFISFTSPALQRVLDLFKTAIFRLGASGRVEMPASLEGTEVVMGGNVYTIGIGGLHSNEKQIAHYANEQYVIRDSDVASYYPNLILNSGAYPDALGPTFLREFGSIKEERLAAKNRHGKLKKAGDTSSEEFHQARAMNEGGKIMINGTFGKTGSPWSVLFAPKMLIQTTVTGQLSLLMLIEWHAAYGIECVQANTDGVVFKTPRNMIELSDFLIKEWESRTGLEMESTQYLSILSRDVNNYFAVKEEWDDKAKCYTGRYGGEVKRKGEYAKTSLMMKKDPGLEICSDAVGEFLATGKMIEATIMECRDIGKFLTMQKVAGGAVKLWGEGPRKGIKVKDMLSRLESHGWKKRGRRWFKPYTAELLARSGSGTGAPVAGFEPDFTASDAYAQCFDVQQREYLGKIVRWYYGSNSPGPIVYASNGNTVSLSYGAKPCMRLPDEFPTDIDYAYYISKAYSILSDVGFNACIR